MTTVIECPVEGCEYEGQLQQVSSHSNASPDHPNWSELKDQVAPPEGGSEEGSDEDGDDDHPESSTDDTTSTPSEGAPEEGSGEGSNDSDQNDPDSMDDDQWTKATDPDEQDDDQGTDQSDDPADDDSGGIPIPVSSTVVFWGVGLLVTAFILYQFIQSDSSENDVEDVEIESEDTDEPVETAGGLIEG